MNEIILNELPFDMELLLKKTRQAVGKVWQVWGKNTANCIGVAGCGRVWQGTGREKMLATY